MIRLLAALALCALPGFGFPCSGGPGCVQAISDSASASATTIALTFDSDVTAGRMILVHASCNCLTTAGADDTLGSIYTPIATRQHTGVTFTQFNFWAPAASSGPNTVTITFGASVNFRVAIALELSGVDVVSPVDGTPAGDSGDGADVDTGPITTTNANDLIVCSLSSWSSTGSFSEVDGFIENNYIGGADAGELQSKSVSATGSYNCAPTHISGSNFKWIAEIFALKSSTVRRVGHRVLQ